jgi:hypothetical protein
MKTPCSLKLVRTYALVVGAMDLSTGLALMAAPAFTLARMGAAVPGAEALGYVRFSGAFVAAVGASYLLALRRRPRDVAPPGTATPQGKWSLYASMSKGVAGWRRGALTPRDIASDGPARAVGAPRLHGSELVTLPVSGDAGLWGATSAARLRGAFEFTLVARTAAGGFALVAVATGLFDRAWLMVAATDLGCAAVQGWMLRKGIAEDE